MDFTWRFGPIALAVAATWWFVAANDYNWRAFILAAVMLAFGALSANMLYDFWVPPRRR
jgi:hypothetical protein